jgi:uncharacterized membrane protein HdeD (DUF308 family)
VLYFRQKKHKPKNFFQLMRINDKTHLHHLLLERVPSHRKVALIEWSVTLLVGVLALLFAGAELAAAITVVLILLIVGGFYLRRNLLST